MKLIKLPHGLLIVLASLVLCGFESFSYYNIPVWHGNVTITNVSKDSSTKVLFLNFDYADGKHGYTNEAAIVSAARYGHIPWLWCNVSHSGSASCWLPKLEK